MIESPYLAQAIHRLVVQSGADNVKRRHGQHHHHAADHAGCQRHQPAVLREHLKKTNSVEQKGTCACILIGHLGSQQKY